VTIKARSVQVKTAAAGQGGQGAQAGRAGRLGEGRRAASANAVGLHASKKKAATFWEAVDNDSAAATTKPKPADGIKKLWLDKPVPVTLDQSVPQIGAPEAWAAGDGTRTKVAILDTRIDPQPPRCGGAGEEDAELHRRPRAVDHHGHGTDVPSTIAGSGAASGGKYKGVAPGADLDIGKVLSSAGRGDQAGVVAGMEWAVAQGADVVSMSLGSDAPQ
jgi:subtilisin family serine protease